MLYQYFCSVSKYDKYNEFATKLWHWKKIEWDVPQLSTKSTLLEARGFKHVELICRRISVPQKRLEVSASIIPLNIFQNIICSEKSAVNHMQSLKTSQDRSEVFLCFKPTTRHWVVKKLLYYVRRSAENVGTCYCRSLRCWWCYHHHIITHRVQGRSSRLFNYGFWIYEHSIIWIVLYITIFKVTYKSNQTPAVKACSKILKTAKILLSQTNQESTSIKICDKQDDSITKKV